MIEPHDLGELTARLGAPHLEQFTHRTGEGACLLVHWGCGCTGMGLAGASDARTALRWSRCAHHMADAVEA